MRTEKPLFDLNRHLERKPQGRKFNIWVEMNTPAFSTFSNQGLTIYWASASMDLSGEIEMIGGQYFIYNLDGHIDFLDKAQNLVGSYAIKSGENTDNGFAPMLSKFLGQNAIDFILKNGGLDDNQD